MAESTLSTTLDDIRDRLIRVMFRAGTDYDTAPADDRKVVDFAIRSGLRQFYAPPPLPGERIPHVWSFLYPEKTISVYAAITLTNSGLQTAGSTLDVTGTPFLNDQGGAFATGDFSPHVDQTIKFTTSGNLYTITSVTDSDTVEVSPNLKTADLTDALKSTLLAGDYSFPDDFGQLEGTRLTFDATTSYPPIVVTSDDRIRRLRMDNRNIATFRPSLANVRPRVSAHGTTGQRFELVLWPNPDATYLLHYRFLVLVDDLTNVAHYPLAHMLHHETVMAACLSVAESMVEHPPRRRFHHDLFMERLAASVMLDRAQAPASLGMSVDPLGGESFSRLDQLQNVSVNNVTYPT